MENNNLEEIKAKPKLNANWIEILVVGIFLSTLGWLCLTVYGLNGTVSTIDSKMETTKEDIIAIKGILPDINKALASEEIQKPIDAALITTKPYRNKEGNLVKSFKVINTKDSEMLTYTVALKNQTDIEKTLIFNGAIHYSSTSPISFTKLIKYSLSENKEVSISPKIDIKNSFVIKNIDSLDLKVFTLQFGVPKVEKINIAVSNWNELNEEFKNTKSQIIN
jgi:hypothetical protein